MLPYFVRFYPESGLRARVAQFSFSDVLSRLVAKGLSRRTPARLHGQHTLSSASIWVYGMPQGALPGRGGQPSCTADQTILIEVMNAKLRIGIFERHLYITRHRGRA